MPPIGTTLEVCAMSDSQEDDTPRWWETQHEIIVPQFPSEYMRRRPSSPEPDSENGKQATGTRVDVDTADAAILPVGDAIPTKFS